MAISLLHQVYLIFASIVCVWDVSNGYAQNTVVSASPPPFPTTYSTVISVTYTPLDYTNAYIESWDGNNQILYTRGRAMQSEAIEVVDFSRNLIAQIAPNGSNSDIPCVASAINASQTITEVAFAPTAYILSTLPSSVGITIDQNAWHYAGMSTAARGINSDMWINAYTSTKNGTVTNCTLTYYDARSGTGVVGLSAGDPVRLEMDITTENEPTNTVIYDWVRFNHSAPIAVDTTIPNSCIFQMSDSSMNVPMPMQSTVASPPTSASPFPGLPDQFQAVIEVKLNSTSGTRIETITWRFDAEIMMENVQYLAPITGPTTAIYDDDNQFVYIFSAYGCEVYPFSTDDQSPLAELREGSISTLFTNVSAFGTGVYIGQSMARGVLADVWRFSNLTKTNGGAIYSFHTDVYFFPVGWQFPGRSLKSTTQQLPLRIVNTGTYATSTAASVPYNDIWDIFLLLTTPPAPSFFDIYSLNCSASFSNSSLPVIPTHYSTTVSANFVNKGYTLAYNEYYDSSLGLLRTDGKFASNNMIEVIDYLAGTSILFPRPGTGDPNDPICSVGTVPIGISSQSGAALLTLPSIYLFQIFNTSSLVYQGQSQAARNILCNFWTGSFFQTRQNNTITSAFSASYYFSVATNTPVRVVVYGSHTSATNPSASANYDYYHVYDWVDFVAGAQPSSLFASPSVEYCSSIVEPDASIALPLESTVVAAPTFSNIPPVPNLGALQQWSAVLETKMVDANSSLYAVRWYYDATNLRERIDYSPYGTSATHTSILEYTAGLMPTAGWDYRINGGVCTVSAISGSNRSPLLNARAGSVPYLFYNVTFNNYSSAAYMGRSSARGIICDIWTWPSTIYNLGQLYVFNSTAYFYAQGWQFPGISIPVGTPQLPVRIVNTGYVYNNVTGSRPFNDTWDFFSFVPGARPDVFDLNSLSCPNPVPSNSSSAQTVAMGALMGVLLGVIITGGSAYLCLQRIKAKKESEDRIRRLALEHVDESDEDDDAHGFGSNSQVYGFSSDTAASADPEEGNDSGLVDRSAAI